MRAPPPVPVDAARDTAPPGFGSWLFGALRALVGRLPLGLADRLAWGVAWVWWTLVPVRRAKAVANLRAALPEVAPRPTLLRMMHDLVLGYVELLQFERLELVVEGAEEVDRALVLAGHGGAWDVALCAYAERFPLSIFLRTPRDRRVQALLAEVRDAHGVHRLETGATMADAYAAIEAGRSVYFIQDQRHNKGPALPFFGRPARTSLGLAVAALKTGRPVYGAWQWREGVGRHRCVLRRLDLSGDAEAITTQLNEFYAEQIRARPHGWLWMHDRWK